MRNYYQTVQIGVILVEQIIIGIDLGVNNTRVCVGDKNKPRLVRFQGEKMLSSMLYVEPDASVFVGRKARNMSVIDSDNSICSFRSFIGDPDKKWKLREKSLDSTNVITEFLRQVKISV